MTFRGPVAKLKTLLAPGLPDIYAVLRANRSYEKAEKVFPSKLHLTCQRPTVP